MSPRMKGIQAMFATVVGAHRRTPPAVDASPIRLGDTYRHKESREHYTAMYVGLIRQAPSTEWTAGIVYVKQATGEVFMQDFATWAQRFDFVSPPPKEQGHGPGN